MNDQLLTYYMKSNCEVRSSEILFKSCQLFFICFRPNCFQIVVQHFSEEQYIFYFAGEAPEHAQVIGGSVLAYKKDRSMCASVSISFVQRHYVFKLVCHFRPLGRKALIMHLYMLKTDFIFHFEWTSYCVRTDDKKHFLNALTVFAGLDEMPSNLLQ